MKLSIDGRTVNKRLEICRECPSFMSETQLNSDMEMMTLYFCDRMKNSFATRKMFELIGIPTDCDMLAEHCLETWNHGSNEKKN